MQTFKIKPLAGISVLDPDSKQPLKKSGEVKPRNEYWLRRLVDGVVIEINIKPTKENK